MCWIISGRWHHGFALVSGSHLFACLARGVWLDSGYIFTSVYSGFWERCFRKMLMYSSPCLVLQWIPAQRQFTRLLVWWYFYSPLYLAVDCSTLPVPEECIMWVILGDDFRMDAVFSSLLGLTVDTSLRQFTEAFGVFSPAALVVDIGSGMCWLFCWLRYTSCCVSFDVAVRGVSTGAVLEQVIALAVEARGDSTGAVLGQGDLPVWCFWSDNAENCGFSAVPFHRWSSTSRSWCRGRLQWFYCSINQEILVRGDRCPCCAGRVSAGCRARQMPMVLTLRIPLRCRRCSSCVVVDVAVLMQRCDPAVGPDRWDDG